MISQLKPVDRFILYKLAGKWQIDGNKAIGSHYHDNNKLRKWKSHDGEHESGI